MPGNTLPKSPAELSPPQTLAELQRYVLDLDALLRFLSDEANLNREESATLVAKLAQQYLTDLHPQAEALELLLQEYSDANVNLSA